MRGEWVTVRREGTEYKDTQKRVTVWSGEVGQSAEEGHPLEGAGEEQHKKTEKGIVGDSDTPWWPDSQPFGKWQRQAEAWFPV